MIRFERIVGALPAGFGGLQEEARAGGHRMLDTLAAEWASGRTRFDRQGEALYGAFRDDTLAGIGGLTVEPAVAGAFRMRRFYVLAACRRSGVARQLAEAILAPMAGSGRFVTANAAAGSEPFWESLGFVADRHPGWTHILTC